jgi:hypothetical protein
LIHSGIGRQIRPDPKGAVTGLLARSLWASVMPLYFFRIRNGRYSGASEQGIELADHDAAWRELTRTCADMVGGICRKLGRNTQWEMELLDESKQPIFRISLASDSPSGSRSKDEAVAKR